MHDQDISQSGSGSDDFPNGREDSKWQRAVLAFLLAQYPHQLSKLELARELLGENPGFRERDACERAIEDLIRVGLLQRCEAMILVTRVARHMHGLELG